MAHVGGTLLGGAFDADGGMYLADATRGLLYIAADDVGVVSKVRIVAALAPVGAGGRITEALTDESLAEGEIRFANDVVVDQSTGTVYFTDSTRIAPQVTTGRLGKTFQVRSVVDCPFVAAISFVSGK